MSVLDMVEPELMHVIEFEGSCLLAQLRKRGVITCFQEEVIRVRTADDYRSVGVHTPDEDSVYYWCLGLCVHACPG